MLVTDAQFKKAIQSAMNDCAGNKSVVRRQTHRQQST